MAGLDDIQISFAQGGDWETLPEDIYNVVIASITPIEAQKYQSEEMETVLKFEFEVADGEYKGSKLFRRIRPKLGIKPKPSNLYLLWSAVIGKQPGEEAFNDFHLSNLIGKELRVTVKNTTKGDNTYNNIDTFLTSKPGTKKEKEEEVDVDKVIDEMEKK